MQICTRCNNQSSDSALTCPHCQADLREFSSTAVALKKYRENPRVKSIRIIAPADACPICNSITGIYEKDKVPELPLQGCSRPGGCCSFYEPVLQEIYP